MKKNWRFLTLITLILVLLTTVIGVATNVSAASICSPASAISVPFAKDGVGNFCYVSTSLCGFINSWNMTAVEVNGTAYTNQWVSSASIPALNGTYTIHYNSTSAFGHFEIGGTPCSSGPTSTQAIKTPTLTPTNGVSPTRTRTATNGPSLTPTSGASPSRTFTRTITPSATRTLINTPTQNQGLSLKVQYRPGDANASTTSIQPSIRIVNTGSISVPLDDLAVTYWYTWEGTTQTQTWTCVSATIPGGCTNIVGDFAPINPVRPGADFALTNLFVIGIGEIAPGQSIEIQYRLNKSDSSLYTQTGDYSFDPSFTTYTDWPKITLFHYPSSKVIWGVEPVAPTLTPTLTPTATMTGGICAPVEATITAPFDFTGAGTHCWRISSLNSLNSNNLSLLSVNGLNITNTFATAASLPPQINGYWYITYASNFPWGHLQIFQ